MGVGDKHSLQLISCICFYNQLQQKIANLKKFLLVDGRPIREIVKQGHIISAISIPPLSIVNTDKKGVTLDEIMQANHQMFDESLEDTDIILYDNISCYEESYDELRWIVQLSKIFFKSLKARSIQILTTSFQKFQIKYPFMIHKEYQIRIDSSYPFVLHKKKSLEKPQVDYPCIIEEDSLFLGCNQHALSEEIISNLRITHIFNCSSEPHTNLFEGHGIKYYHMIIKSKGNMESSVLSAFDEAYNYLTTIKKQLQPPRVLIYSSRGISGCCSLAVYYFMRFHQCNLLDAYNYIRKCRPNMMPRDGIIRLFLIKEKEWFQSNSIQEDELRTFIHGSTTNSNHNQHNKSLGISLSDHLYSSNISINPSLGCRKTYEKKKMNTKRPIHVESVTCTWLYNRLQSSSGMILLDIRSRKAFSMDTIPCSLNIPSIDNQQHGSKLSFSSIISLCSPEQEYLFSRRKLMEIVIFGEHEDIKHPSCWCRYLIDSIVTEGLVGSIKVLQEGFTTFHFRYPFLTLSFETSSTPRASLRTESGLHAVTYPNEILDGFLYLGNMWQASQHEIIKNLNVSHIINASLDCMNEHAEKGVYYLNVDIKDYKQSNISKFFQSAVAFIDEAKQAHGGRVLVHCTQGVSRSATIVIYYLMWSKRWSLVTAVNHTLSCRAVIYPNLGFMKQLFHAESNLYDANSIQLEEIDLLLQGGIPDRPVATKRNQSHASGCFICQRHFSFSLFPRRFHCNYCNKSLCSKCSTTRLLDDKEIVNDNQSKGHSVCTFCIKKLWVLHVPTNIKNISLPVKRKSIRLRSSTNHEKPVQLTYIEGTDANEIMRIILCRFSVSKDENIIELLLENRNRFNIHQSIPDDTIVHVSIGAAGDVHRQNEIVLMDKETCIVSPTTSNVSCDTPFETQENPFLDLWHKVYPKTKSFDMSKFLRKNTREMVLYTMIGLKFVDSDTGSISQYHEELLKLGCTESHCQIIIHSLQSILDGRC